MNRVEIRVCGSLRLLYSVAVAVVIAELVAMRVWTSPRLLAIAALTLLCIVEGLIYSYGVVLVIDDQAIRYREPGHPWGFIEIPWHEIATVTPRLRSRALALNLSDPRLARGRLWLGARLNLVVTWALYGHEFGVPLRGLDRPAEEVLGLIQDRMELASAKTTRA